ncbi:MAG: septation ring formation regulator EzrA [bacterium]|nr:septation ring formation regulator EzrA [bacterium]
MKLEYFYILSGIAVFVILLLVFFLVFKKRKKYGLQKELQELERQRNLIVSTPIPSELAKIEVIIKNEKLEEKYNEWCERYKNIKEVRFSEITDVILDIDGLIEQNDLKEAKSRIQDLEMEIFKLRTTTDNLLDEIREITMSEERNRAIITKLKSRYRELQRTLENNKNAYGDIYKYIELQLENIEKRFTDFETVMEDNNYSEIVSIVKVIDEMIAHISTVIEEVPDLILLTNKIIPERIKEVNDTYTTMLGKSYPLDYLNVPYNISQIEHKTKEIVDKIKILNLEECMFSLKTFLDYLDNLLNDFDVEKRSRKIFDEVAKSFREKLNKINKIVSDIYEQLDDIKSMYNLTSDDLEEFSLINKNLLEINNTYNNIIGDLKNKREPYSVLREEIEKLTISLQDVEERFDACLRSLGSMKEDEQRAREQLDEITELLKKCKANIRSYNLPIISNNYFVELSEANEAIYEIIKELEKTPITIKTLNIRVDTARDLSLKLASTTNEMVKTAKLSEMIITYGNRYKPLDKDIEKGLDAATQLFFKGNYKKSLETSIASINIIEPDIYKKMLNMYKKN